MKDPIRDLELEAHQAFSDMRQTPTGASIQIKAAHLTRCWYIARGYGIYIPRAIRLNSDQALALYRRRLSLAMRNP